jgi:hypothetical protein
MISRGLSWKGEGRLELLRIRLRQLAGHGNVLCSIRRGVRSIVGDEEKEVV